MSRTANPSTMSRRKAFSLGAASGLLLWLSYFPANLGFIVWFALVPLLLVVRYASGRRAQLAAWTAALCFYLPALSWMAVAHPTMIAAWLALTLLCSIYMSLAAWLLRRIDSLGQYPLTLTVPIVWTAMEFLQGRMFGGFAWYFLGHAQHNSLAFVQIADIGGELTVTLVVAAINGLIADAMTRSRVVVRRAGIAVAGLLIVSLAYGSWRLSANEFTPGPRVALLQGNIPQDLRNAASGDGGQAEQQERQQAQFIHKHYVALAERAAHAKPDLCIWPETSLPESLTFLAPNVSIDAIPMERRLWIEETKEELKAIAQKWGIPQLLGVVAWELGVGRRMEHFNAAVLVNGQGVVRARYNKIHRVPFGEFVPLREVLPWLQMFTPYEDDYSVAPGRELTRFPIEAHDKQFTFGVLICYEDADTQLARQYVTLPAVDFLVNISNDGWFKGWPEHEQHLAVARFRAIECRRAMVRAVNMGISAVIDSNGRLTHLPGDTWSASKAIEGVVVAYVPIDNRVSFYAMTGDWLPWTCWAAIVVLAFWPSRSI